MKKILLIFVLLLSLVLVACDNNGDITPGGNTVDISNVVITDNVLEADLTLKVTYEDTDALYELVYSAANLVYDHYKLDFGTKMYTLYFTVFEKDSSDALGVISFKVNSSLENPGLNYVGDNLSN